MLEQIVIVGMSMFVGYIIGIEHQKEGSWKKTLKKIMYDDKP